jgi:hypothetical protein
LPDALYHRIANLLESGGLPESTKVERKVNFFVLMCPLSDNEISALWSEQLLACAIIEHHNRAYPD